MMIPRSTLAQAVAMAMVVSASMIGPARSADLRVNGAATIARAIITPNLAAIEQETGLRLVLTVNGDGNGLRDLSAGRADVAMMASPIKAAGEALNKASPGAIDVTGYEVATVGSAIIRFIVNPQNPVRTLSEAQLRDILLGKVASWKDVGGDAVPIVVVAEVPGFGTHTSVVSTLLGGTEFVSSARLVQALVQLTQVTAQIPGAISYGNSASINDSVAVISGVEVKQELGLATKGPPSPEVRKLIAAVTKYGATAK